MTLYPNRKETRGVLMGLFRALLAAGIVYAGWKVRYIETTVVALTADVAYIKGRLAGRG